MSENVLLVSEAAEPGDDGSDFILITRSGGEAVDVGKGNVTRDFQVLTENRLDTSLQDIPIQKKLQPFTTKNSSHTVCGRQNSVPFVPSFDGNNT